jgi:hypothetical protein
VNFSSIDLSLSMTLPRDCLSCANPQGNRQQRREFPK